jgi:hypothetical protein
VSSSNHDKIIIIITNELKGLTHGLSVVTLYVAERLGQPPPFQFIVVAEERIEQRWMKAPRKMCHVATHEINYDPGKVSAISTFKSISIYVCVCVC